MKDSKMIMVYIQCGSDQRADHASLEALSEAADLAKRYHMETAAVLIGRADDEIRKTCRFYGAQKLIEMEAKSHHIRIVAKSLAFLIRKHRPFLLLSGDTEDSEEILAYAAAVLGGSAVSQVLDLKIRDEAEFTVAMYGGSVLRQVRIRGDGHKLAILRRGAFQKRPMRSETFEVIREEPIRDQEVFSFVKESVRESVRTIPLEEAKVVVCCGKGMDSKEGRKLIGELAESLGGVVAATRAVVEDGNASRSQLVGRSGKIVAPRLYIACGVSGAIQHTTAILGSDFILAVNKDEDAAIFDVADIGIVGDGMIVLPELIREIKKC